MPVSCRHKRSPMTQRRGGSLSSRRVLRPSAAAARSPSTSSQPICSTRAPPASRPSSARIRRSCFSRAHRSGFWAPRRGSRGRSSRDRPRHAIRVLHAPGAQGDLSTSHGSEPQDTASTLGIRAISLPANDLAFDPTSGRIYASTPGRAGAAGNSIVPIDPQTGVLGAAVFIGSEPGPLARSDDGRYLYVGLDGAFAVRRLRSSLPDRGHPVLPSEAIPTTDPSPRRTSPCSRGAPGRSRSRSRDPA